MDRPDPGSAPRTRHPRLYSISHRFKEEYVVTFSDGELSYDDEGKSKTGITLGGKTGMGADFKASEEAERRNRHRRGILSCSIATR